MKKPFMTFRHFLLEKQACEIALEWVGNKSAYEAWRTCKDPGWLMWLCEEVLPGAMARKADRAGLKARSPSVLIFDEERNDADCKGIRSVVKWPDIKLRLERRGVITTKNKRRQP